MGVSDFRRFGATEKAVWPLGRAGAAAFSGWVLFGPELTVTKGQSDRRDDPIAICGRCTGLEIE
eukprot:3003205-Alexandrium_andersonii.AAC.1